MKRKLTLAIEEKILDRARLIAARKKRTLTGMIREYLQKTVQEELEKKVSLGRLIEAMKSKPLAVGRSSWKRSNLYTR